MAITPANSYRKPTPPPPPPPKKEEKSEAKPVANAPAESGARVNASTATPPAGKTAPQTAKPSTVQDGFDTAPSSAQPVMLAASPATSAPTPSVDDSNLTPTELAPAGAASTSMAAAPSQTAPVSATAPAQAPTAVSGEDKAKQELDIQTVSEDRAAIEKGQKELHEQTNATSNELFGMADGHPPPPPGTKVTRTPDGQVELTRLDEQGQPVESTRASRREDGTVMLDSSSYKDGTNYRAQTEVRGDGNTRVQRAEWKGSNETLQPRSFDDISRSRDPNFTYTDNFVSMQSDGKLAVDEYSQSGGAVSGSRTEYFQQSGDDWDNGIDDKLEGPFNRDQPVDRADTYTYSIPAPQDGKQGEAMYQRTQRFSQENYQTTSVVDTALKDEQPQFVAGRGATPPRKPTFYKDNVRNEFHNREDFDTLRNHTQGKAFEKNFDANQAQEKGQPPKRWYTEWKNGPDELRTQTGVEGYPKATVVTDKKRSGNTITEKYAGHTFKPDAKDMDDLAEVGGESSRTYAQDGSVENAEMRRVNADGSKEESHYKSRTEQTPDGLVHHEYTDNRYTKDGQSSWASKQDRSLITAEGIQLLGTTSTMTGPDGSQAVSSLDEHGESLTLTGPNGQAPRAIDDSSDFASDAEKDLALKAATSTVETTKAYVDHVGVKALDAMEYIGDKAGNPPLSRGMAKVFDAQALNHSLTEVRDARLGGSVASHSLGAISGAMGLAAGIRSGNKQDIIVGALSTAWGAGHLVMDGKSVLDRVRGNNPYNSSFVDKLAAPGLEALSKSSSAGKAIANTVAKMGGASRALGSLAGPGLDVFTGAMDIKNGLEGGHTGQFAKGVVGVVGGAAGMVAAIALSGPAAVVVAPLIGIGVAIISGLIELFTDDKHQIAELRIDDDDFQVTPPDYDSAAAAPPPPPPEPTAEDYYYYGAI